MDIESNMMEGPHVDNSMATIPSHLKLNIQNTDHESNVSKS